MPATYTPASRAARSLLVHAGNLRVNQVNVNVPAEFLYSAQSVSPPTAVTGAGTGVAFTHFDAGVMQASAYDELIVDVQPAVTYANGAAQVATVLCGEAYNQLQMAGRPFWVAIDPTGYGQPFLYASAASAQAAALAVMNAIYGDVLGLQVANFRGFALLQPDLNVMFTDGSVITRTMQGALVQQCWALNCAACVVTTRPNDSLAMVGPQIADLPAASLLLTPTPNPNSRAALANPILGANVARRDKIVALYPNDQATGHNASVVMGQLAAFLTTSNRDPGFVPNLDYAYAVPVDDSMMTADGTGGVTPAGVGLASVARVLAYAAATGVTSLGVYSAAGSVNVPAPARFMPADAKVNTTGASSTWGDGGNLYVISANPDGTVGERQFSSSFVETVPYAGVVAP